MITTLKKAPRNFKKRRFFLLLILPMIFYNFGMSLITGSLGEAIASGEITKFLMALFIMSIFGLLLTPASIALIIFSTIIEKVYVKGFILPYWLFCIIGGAIGLLIFIAITVTSEKSWDINQLLLIFGIHLLTTRLVYSKSQYHNQL